MRYSARLAATAAFLLAAAPAFAGPTVDGAVTTGEYGSPTATVATNAGAPVSNFGTPTGAAGAGYDIYLNDTGDTLYGAIVQTGGTAAGAFANLYFDIDPVTGSNGSDLGIEVGNLRGFVPGSPGYFDLSGRISYSSTTVGGLTTFEFSIENSVFRDYIAGMTSAGYFGAGSYTPQNVRLNLSQSLTYSVAGGQDVYGSSRLGTFSIAAPAAVPETATWAMMLTGFGVLGAAMRRRKATAAFA